MLSEAIADERCRFRTTQPVEILPITVEARNSPDDLDRPEAAERRVGVLRLTLKCTNKTVSFAGWRPIRSASTCAALRRGAAAL